MKPLALGTSVADVITTAKSEHRPLDIEASARELYLRFYACGYSWTDIAGALEAEASAAGVEARHFLA